MSNDIPTEALPMTEQDAADVIKLFGDESTELFDGAEAPSYHTILEVWREVLKPARTEASKPVTPQWASRITASYREINYADMNEVRDRYYGKILELAHILDLEIATDADCLSYGTPAEDVAENTVHYKNLLLLWQQTFLQWELEWDCTEPLAGVELASIAEVHKAIFGETGLTAFLDNIKFVFTEDDQAELGAALEEMRQTYVPGAVTGE